MLFLLLFVIMQKRENKYVMIYMNSIEQECIIIPEVQIDYTKFKRKGEIIQFSNILKIGLYVKYEKKKSK